jgi:protein ImuB
VDLDWALQVQVFKRRGPVHEGEVSLPSVPGSLGAVLPSRLQQPRRWLAARRSAVPQPVAVRPEEASADAHADADAWAALCWPAPAEGAPAVDLQGPACWALQFTPRVARCGEALRLELAASQRLFGGQVALLSRLANEGRQLGASGVAWASTASAAQALARQHAQAAWADGGEGAGPDPSRVPGLQQPLADALDPLPLETLDGLRPHADTLHLMGCHRLGEVRRLPRAGLARRFEAGLLAALDQAYGTLPEAHTWLTLPETFSARLELAFRVEQAPALLAGAQRLLLQLCGWLQARHAGVLAFTLAWEHDSMRARDVAPGGALTVRTAQPARQAEHLTRLLAEHLARVTLAAPRRRCA